MGVVSGTVTEDEPVAGPGLVGVTGVVWLPPSDRVGAVFESQVEPARAP